MELHDLLAKKFVQRKDVKAVQTAEGYYPERRIVNGVQENVKWTRTDFLDHVNGTRTFGHYLSDRDSLVKLFVFDIDLEKKGTWVERPDLSTAPDDAFTGPHSDAWLAHSEVVHESTPRVDWLNRRHPGRQWYKGQLRTMAEMLSSSIHKELGLQVACAYSGNKGLHVYGFLPEPTHASKARSGALLALEAASDTFSSEGEFVPFKGTNFYRYNNDDPVTGFMNLSIEIFPKQDSMDGKDLGNLVRLPLGTNLKNPKDPTFFLDQRAPHDSLVPHPDPVALLLGKSPWED